MPYEPIVEAMRENDADEERIKKALEIIDRGPEMYEVSRSTRDDEIGWHGRVSHPEPDMDRYNAELKKALTGKGKIPLKHEDVYLD